VACMGGQVQNGVALLVAIRRCPGLSWTPSHGSVLMNWKGSGRTKSACAMSNVGWF
jgi:hypothetical protein